MNFTFISNSCFITFAKDKERINSVRIALTIAPITPINLISIKLIKKFKIVTYISTLIRSFI